MVLGGPYGVPEMEFSGLRARPLLYLSSSGLGQIFNFLESHFAPVWHALLSNCWEGARRSNVSMVCGL